jgi:pyruvate formate lyase activating enzyme
MARKHLKYVYVGNSSEESPTHCPQCGNLLIERNGYRVNVKGIEKGLCVFCGAKAEVVL